MYSIDSSSSGAQLIAMLLRSKKLAKCVQLYTPPRLFNKNK